jgi:hypothetical protein
VSADKQYLALFNNDLLEGETISCGVVLRIYNKNPTIFLRCTNEFFLKTLLSSFDANFKKYIKLSKFIKKHSGENKLGEEEEEKNVSEDEEGKVYLIWIELNPQWINEYKRNNRRLIYDLTLYLTSALLNIKANSEDIESDLTYTERTAISIVKDHLEEHIPWLFSPLTPCLLRYTFMQIAVLLPDLIGVNQLVEFLQSQKEHGWIVGVQLALAVLLKVTMAEDFDFYSLNTESIDTIFSIGLQHPAYLKLIELILNWAKRKDSLEVKLDQLKNSDTKINWKIVDDVCDESQDSHSTFGASSSKRYFKLDENSVTFYLDLILSGNCGLKQKNFQGKELLKVQSKNFWMKILNMILNLDLNLRKIFWTSNCQFYQRFHSENLAIANK